MVVIDEVNKPIEVEDKSSLTESTSSTSTKEERIHMDMEDMSSNTTLDNEKPQHTTLSGNP